MKKLLIDPGVCGFRTLVTAVYDEEEDEVTLRVDSGCQHVREMMDALGDTYPDCAWEAVYVSPDGAAWGMNRFFNEDTGALERCEMTRLKITVS